MQKTPKIFYVAAVVLVVGLASAAFGGDGISKTSNRAKVHPALVRGPQAIPSSIASPEFGLFTCQVGLSSRVCYDPFQIRHAYNTDNLINAGFTGKGKTIVIVDAYQSPHIVAQLNFYDNFYGLPSLNGLGGPANPNLGTFTQVAPDGLTPFIVGDGNQTGWAEEISLDVLWAHAIAPGANITLVLAKSNNDEDILSATRFAVNNNLGDVISQSFGENESCVDPTLLAQQHEVFAEATRKNITLFASSGDDGAAQGSCDGSALVKAVSSPASDPLVTAVGGTELHAAKYCLASLGCDPATNPAPGTYQGEVVWNEDGIGSTGGGFSVLFDKPNFQDGTLKGGGKQRGVPDIAYSAAVLHGALTYLDIPGVPVGFFLFGGTSAGSPQWAAITAIADQKAGRNLGFINDALYHIGKNKNRAAAAMHDVTSGNNTVSFLDDANSLVTITGFDAVKGWDASTGFGSLISDQMAALLDKTVGNEDGKNAIQDSAPKSSGKGPSGHGNSGRQGPH